MNGWTTFWLAVATYVVCECTIYLHGHDTFFWVHKTPAELRLQQKQVNEVPA